MDKYNNVESIFSAGNRNGGNIEFGHKLPIYILDKSLKVYSVILCFFFDSSVRF
jgi:hypothetical protein